MKSILRNKAVFFFKPKQGPNKFLNISSWFYTIVLEILDCVYLRAIL